MGHIIGLDPSLTATGWARHEAGNLTFGTLQDLPPKQKKAEEPLPRIIRVRTESLAKIYPGCQLVVIEGLSFGSNDPSAQERSALHYSLREDLLRNMVTCVVCPPTSLKKFVTGSGGAKKELVMLEVFKRWGFEARDNNAADAIGLAIIGACLLGRMNPTTKEQREVLDLLRKQLPEGLGTGAGRREA